ncbi:ATP-grasp domain-containing protein [Kitasatospora sp. NA04385]|uniref:ATP-grasp domain-containing protein n=1 Tax=Kitasatospora sp. NA04385 TaxID=2742135 RepID=UPI00159076E0|nr:ATP-grasp domain-containing protein [Kitasatospora sp. NA04385]QKW23640.1 ATP-grasp domain-containing protein [Kitasatospora sp. NA04385]
MHIAFVDSNPAALEAVRLATEAGHRVTFLQSADPLYPPTEQNLRILGAVDHLVDGLVTTDPGAVTAALAARHADHPIDVVTSQHEMCTEAVAHACRTLGLRGTDPDAVLTARRKDRCREALDRAGLASARHALAADEAEVLAAAERIGYPVILKPPSGGDSLLSYVARTPEEAAEGCRGILTGLDAVPADWHGQFRRGILVEEYLTGPLVSVELGVKNGEFTPYCVSGRFRWAQDEVVELGSYIPSNLPPRQREDCIAYAVEVCRALGLDLGVFHLEIIHTERGPVLVEVNPRVMGGALPTIYKHATGTDVFTGLLEILDPDAEVNAPAPTDGCVGGRKVMARHGGTLDPAATLERAARHPDVLQVVGFDSYRTGPGRDVAAGQIVARFILRGEDHLSVVRAAEQILHGLEEDLGIELMIGEKD